VRSLYSFSAIALLMLAIAKPTLGQVTQAPLATDLSRTYGYINGQRLNLNRIKKELPDLAMYAQKAELEFQTAFGTAERNINVALQEMLATQYSEYVSKMNAQLETLISSQPLNPELGANFIAEVESRAKGKLESPVLETLLTYQFIDRPEDEVVRGYSRVYRTKGHPKAKGVDFQIRYPASWRPAEGERPNIIQKFVSENGRGLESILLAVKDIPLPEGYKPTKTELDEFFSDRELRGLAPTGARVISVRPIVLDGQKGGMVIFDQTGQRLETTFTMRNVSFVTVRRNKMIFVSCLISSPTGKEAQLQDRFTRIKSLFKWVANSFVLQEQYK
jgi:hypothetical protein